MDERNEYQIIFSTVAAAQMEAKLTHIAENMMAPDTAWNWYRHLQADILRELAFMPEKFPVFNSSFARERTIRCMTTRNDAVLYSVDKDTGTVYVRAIFTRGQDIAGGLERGY